MRSLCLAVRSGWDGVTHAQKTRSTVGSDMNLKIAKRPCAYDVTNGSEEIIHIVSAVQPEYDKVRR